MKADIRIIKRYLKERGPLRLKNGSLTSAETCQGWWRICVGGETFSVKGSERSMLTTYAAQQMGELPIRFEPMAGPEEYRIFVDDREVGHVIADDNEIWADEDDEDEEYGSPECEWLVEIKKPWSATPDECEVVYASRDFEEAKGELESHICNNVVLIRLGGS